jgi:hypothetical protein
VYNPLLTGDPNFTAHFRASTRNATHIPPTHAHDDHIGDTVRVARETGAEIVANFYLCVWLEGQGAQKINSVDTGGKIPCGNFSVDITDARHFASTIDGGAGQMLRLRDSDPSPIRQRRCKARRDSRRARVIARSEATKQSSGRARLLDCFAPLAMTAPRPLDCTQASLRKKDDYRAQPFGDLRISLD